MLQIFLVFLTAVTFVLMAADPRSTDSTEAKSAWTAQNKKSEVMTPTDFSAKNNIENQKQDTDQI